MSVLAASMVACQLPRAWLTSQAFTIDKRNNKIGCPGTRLVHGMAPVGKATLTAAWARQGVEEHAHYQFGCVSSRSREEAILTQQVAAYRIARTGRAVAPIFYDMLNAFSSMSNDVLNIVVE